MGQKQEREKTEATTGLGRITAERTEEWNQMTALRFQTGGKMPGPLRATVVGEGGGTC